MFESSLGGRCVTSSLQNRYREFNVAFRVWRHLQMRKRSGQCHGVKYPNRREDLITVPCFACPWPGVNLPDDWEKTDKDIRLVAPVYPRRILC